MKSIAVVNWDIPSLDGYVALSANQSLLDYDIVVFSPELPYMNRIEFSGGGSCVSIESSRSLERSLKHWKYEINEALKAGKTVFVVACAEKSELLASGYSTPRKGERTYNTYYLRNYSVLPGSVGLRNATGRKFKPAEATYQGLFSAIKDFAEYQVILSKEVSPIFTAGESDRSVGGIGKIEGLDGHMVLLPYFEIDREHYDHDQDVWRPSGLAIGKRIVAELVAIDKMLRNQSAATPRPEWLEGIKKPDAVDALDKRIAKIDTEIASLKVSKEDLFEEKRQIERFFSLLYESGKPLEAAVEATLSLMGYRVENYSEGDVELDHVIVGPSGLRMIGETEGKERSAVGISKFRQLETNINEDFEREDVKTPAKGVLFGNGFRLEGLDARQEGFTSKCLTNAKRLGTALVQTSDLYQVALNIMNYPDDESYKENCRKALEETSGSIVVFPMRLKI